MMGADYTRLEYGWEFIVSTCMLKAVGEHTIEEAVRWLPQEL